MKLYKYSLIAALALSGALSACSDDVEYNAAEPTPGVFFPMNANITALTIEPQAGSFDIEVARYGFSEEQTYSFTNNFAELTGFSMPETVSFAAGQTTAVVNVSYDGAVMTPGVYKLNIGFAENQPVNQFGETALKIAVTLPEPVEVLPWNDLGECTFTDPYISQGLYGSMPTLTYKVHIEESGDTPGLYRLVAPYGSAFAAAWLEANGEGEALGAGSYDADNQLYLEIHAEDPEKVYILPQLLGTTLDSDGEMMGMNLAGLRIDNGQEPEAGAYGTYKDGIITLPSRNSLVVFPYSTASDVKGKAYYGNPNNSVRLVVMPGVSVGDYSATINYVGQYSNPTTGENSALATFSFGEDVVAAKAALLTNGNGAVLGEAVADGSAANIIDIPVGSEGPVAFPVVMAGSQTISVVTYDGAGQCMDKTSISFNMTPYNDDAAWNSLGYGKLADGWIAGVFFVEDIFADAWNVEIQEAKSTPGLYRLVKPWNNKYCILSGVNSSENMANIYIDATDPEFIKIMPQFTGFSYNKKLGQMTEPQGDFYICNVEGYFSSKGYSKDEIIANDMLTTSFDEGMLVIEFPYIDSDAGIPAKKPDGNTEIIHWSAFNEVSAVIFPSAEGEDVPASVKGKAAKSLSGDSFRSSFKIAKRIKQSPAQMRGVKASNIANL